VSFFTQTEQVLRVTALIWLSAFQQDARPWMPRHWLTLNLWSSLWLSVRTVCSQSLFCLVLSELLVTKYRRLIVTDFCFKGSLTHPEDGNFLNDTYLSQHGRTFQNITYIAWLGETARRERGLRQWIIHAWPSTQQQLCLHIRRWGWWHCYGTYLCEGIPLVQYEHDQNNVKIQAETERKS
jgi:hypothetical protein